MRAEFDKLVWDHPPAFDTWLEQIAEARSRGYAVDQGIYISGVTVVAVPVFGPNGNMTRSLVAIGISERLQNSEIPKLAAAMMAIRDDLEEMQMDTGR
ncbi:transcriptional regulator [Aliiruegeria lutimaris]|uniref:Transcriptional regulator n=1 Tax=Aliiruegeria lutimaris TaxID=571298 RepID=A0A1G9PSY9_9RHOB|nr:transcriptional regulator [Aliiruegeria lutimaris]